MKTCDICKKKASGVLPYQMCEDCSHMIYTAMNNNNISLSSCKAKIEWLEEVNRDLVVACKGAMAALTQNKTYPADIEAAKLFLSTAISRAEGKE